VSRADNDTRARLRASDPVDLARIIDLARAPWADDVLARITAHDRTADVPDAANSAQPAARRIPWRPAVVVAAVFAVGVGTAVAALTGAIPDLLGGTVPIARGGLPTDLAVIPSTLAHPIEMDVDGTTWGLWTGRTATDRYLIDVTTQPPASVRSGHHSESVGMCPLQTPAPAVSLCLTRGTSDDGFVAGRIGPDVRSVTLETTARTYPGEAHSGVFLVPASAGRREWRSARLVARAADGHVLATIPVIPGTPS
jgi:hypothetical protein